MGTHNLSNRSFDAAACENKASQRQWRTWVAAFLSVAGLASCARTSPQPEIAAGQRSCVIYHPYYYNGDKRPGESEIKNALTVQLSGGEKYTLRPYRSLQVPIPRSGTVIQVMDDPLSRLAIPRQTESASVPAGSQTAYVRISRSQKSAGMAYSPSGIPMAAVSFIADRAKLVTPEVAKKELAEFE